MVIFAITEAAPAALILLLATLIMDFGSLVERVRGEFIEMPGLQLTEAQAAKLWGIEPRDCRKIVEVLVGADFLRWTPNGRIARAQR